MTRPGQYRTPASLRQALEARLKASCANHFELRRRRQLVVFDRFLARVVQVAGDAIILKGGLVLEMRLDIVRATKDIDLRMSGAPDRVLERLRAAARLSLADFMQFEVRDDPRHPVLNGPGLVYEGRRFRVTCRLADKVYGDPFGVDVAHGDPIVGSTDLIQATDVLGFAGIEPPRIRVYPVVSHVAEKLHAYTLPRDRPNSRVKDLPDIALLASVGGLDAGDLHAALKATFNYRGTHPLPGALPAPPPGWKPAYDRMVDQFALPWTTLDALFGAAKGFLNPVLDHGPDVGVWSARSWAWSTP